MQMKFLSSVIAKGGGLHARQIRVRASDATQDRVGDILEPAGCDLDDYRANPIVLFSHDPAHPVGRASLSVTGNALEGVITFAPEGATRKSDEVCALAKSGVLSGVSVGFEPIECKPIAGGGVRVTKWNLLEISLVSVPCNVSATITERSYRSSRISGRASSYSERQAEIAAFRDSAPSAPPKMSARSAYLLTEAERVLDMSVRLYDSDQDANRARRIVEVARLRG
jgi:HK97 family phage prohead protease